MTFTVEDVQRVLREVYYDMCINYETAKKVFDMTHKARYREFPGELERHAVSEEAKYTKSHPDASMSDLMDVRQEYLTAEILELSSNAAKDRMKNDVDDVDVSLAIRNDPELNSLFNVHEADLIQQLEKIRDSI